MLFKQLICSLFGHKWGYKNFPGLKHHPDIMLFRRKRKCSRCHKYELSADAQGERWQTKPI